MLDIDRRREGILVEKEKSIENCKEKTQKKHYRKIERRKQSKSIGGCQTWGPKWTKIDRRRGKRRKNIIEKLKDENSRNRSVAVKIRDRNGLKSIGGGRHTVLKWAKIDR